MGSVKDENSKLKATIKLMRAYLESYIKSEDEDDLKGEVK